MAKRENAPIPLSRFGIFVAQLESIAASARHQPPDPILCFDLLSELVAAIHDEPKESIVQWQRKCEDALYSLLVLGAKRPVRHLASLAMARVIAKGDTISVYSRVSSLQGWLVDSRKSEPLSISGVAQCLGELYRLFGRRLTSGFSETTSIVARVMKFNEDFVRQDLLQMLHHALEGSGGAGASAAYSEAYRIVMRIGVVDKSSIVRIAAAKCLKSFFDIGGPGLGITDLENAASFCIKALEDSLPIIRDAFAEALGALLALGMNPSQMKLVRKFSTTEKKMEDGLQKYLISPFMRASGVRSKELRIGLTLSWVFFLQVACVKYGLPQNELQQFALQAINMLQESSFLEAQSVACVLYIVRVGAIDQMAESTQRNFLVLLGKQLESSDFSPSRGVATLRTLSYLLSVLGEVPVEFKEFLDSSVVAALSHSSANVRVEAALTLRGLVEVDPTSVGGLVSYGITTLYALRDSVHFGKGNMLKLELDSLHGQAAALSAIVSTSPKLLLGYPARLPSSILDVSKKMLTEFSRIPIVASVQKEAGWLLLGSLVACMPKEELEDQVFDVLLLWTDSLGRHPGYQSHPSENLNSEISVKSTAIDTLSAFIRSFISSAIASTNKTVLLQPVLFYLNGALSYITNVDPKQFENIKPALDLFTIRTLAAYQSLSDPVIYKGDHLKLIQICTSPFREPSGYEESSCLRLLLEKRDSCLGPWTPGRDWFEDELRAFDGGKDGLLPCVWEKQVSTFPQPDTTSKMLVNQMLLCFGCIFAAQDGGDKIKLLNIIDQCLKTGRKQSWHAASVTNACVALLAGLKALIVARPKSLDSKILSLTHSIFEGILAEGDICSSQRRAASEGLGLLARLGSDSFAARMTRSILGNLATATDPFFIGSLIFSLGCIHCSAGGMALATLVPSTVSSISSLARSSNAIVQQWSLHALLLTIEAAGLSYLPHVQATLSLAMDILLSEESGRVNVRQGIGRLVNSVVAVLGPELSPRSTFFSRCKSVIAEISSGQETANLVEFVRFTQQLVLFAPQAVSVHAHVQTLLPTLASKQPTLRQLAISTLKHLIETDPVAVIDERIEENLFVMLDDETDSEIGNLVQETITRLLCVSCPLHPSWWLALCRNLVVAASSKKSQTINSSNGSVHRHGVTGSDSASYHDEDDENMISSSVTENMQIPDYAHRSEPRSDKHLRYRTRIFAAECLSHLPTAVGSNPAHFDLSLAREHLKDDVYTGDWLVLHLHELVSVGYQISTSQFEGIQQVGIRLLIRIMENFEKTPDPELPGHFLLEQSQAQLVSAIRSSVTLSSSPLFMEAGLQLAEKVLTSSVLCGDRVALQRMFLLISRHLDDFKDLYYPSFAEWVACKIRIRLLAAHASIRCHVYSFLLANRSLPEEYHPLLPMFSKSSKLSGYCWISVLKDYFHIRYGLLYKSGYNPFLDGIQSLLVSSKVQECLDKVWTTFLLSTVTDAVPDSFEEPKMPQHERADLLKESVLSGYIMVRLNLKEFRFLWGLTLLALFQDQMTECRNVTPLLYYQKPDDSGKMTPTFHEIPLQVFKCLSTRAFFSAGYLTIDICQELLQVLLYVEQASDSLDCSVAILSQLVIACPSSYFRMENFILMAAELCIKHLFRMSECNNYLSQSQPCNNNDLMVLLSGAEKMAFYLNHKNFVKLLVALQSAGYVCIESASNDTLFAKFVGFLQNIFPIVLTWLGDDARSGVHDSTTLLGAWVNQICSMAHHSIERMHHDSSSKILIKKLSFFLEEVIYIAQAAYGTHFCLKDGDRMPLYALCKLCLKCIQEVITDIKEQISAVGVSVLKNFAQKKPGESSALKADHFLLFFIGEFSEDILLLTRRIVRGQISTEGMAILEDCLRLLFIFHCHSYETTCLQPSLVILLEAIRMVNEVHTKELSHVQNVARVLVSHLVQTPSSAILIKDILLSMEPAQRQQFQEILRSSTVSMQTTKHAQSSSSFPIRLPTKPDLDKQDPQPSGFQSHENFSDKKENDASSGNVDINDDDDDDGDEDWDTFQSFPASNTNSNLDFAKTGSQPDSSTNPTMPEDPILEDDQLNDEILTADQNDTYAETRMEHNHPLVGVAEENVRTPDDVAKTKPTTELLSGNIDIAQNNADASEFTHSAGTVKNMPEDNMRCDSPGLSVQSGESLPSCEGTLTDEFAYSDASNLSERVSSTNGFTEENSVAGEEGGTQKHTEDRSSPPPHADEVIETNTPNPACDDATIGDGQKDFDDPSNTIEPSTNYPVRNNDQ